MRKKFIRILSALVLMGGCTFAQVPTNGLKKEQIFYVANSPSNVFTIYKVNSDGTNKTQVFNDSYTRSGVCVTKEAELYYIKRDLPVGTIGGKVAICKSDMNGKNETEIWSFPKSNVTDLRGNIDLSADEKKILYATYYDGYPSISPGRDGDVFELDLTTFVSKNISNNNDYPPQGVAKYSPDMSKIVYIKLATTWYAYPWNMYMTNSDGSNNIQLKPDGNASYYCPNFSNDGLKIVYCSYTGLVSPLQLFISNSNGTNGKRIIPSKGAIDGIWYPTFSPDNSKIVFFRDNNLVIIDTLGNVLNEFPSEASQDQAKIVWTNAEPIDLNSGLVAYYPFNGNANDESGNQNNGIVTDATLTTDRFGNEGKAYSFDGSGDYIKVKNSTSLEPTQGLTISAWVKADLSSQCWIVRKSNASDAGYFLARYGTHIQMVLNSPGLNCQAGAGTNSTPYSNQWRLFTGTYQKSTKTMNFYIDDQLIETKTDVCYTLEHSGDLFIGADDWESSYQTKGVIDEVRIYDRALDASEVKALYLSTENQSPSHKLTALDNKSDIGNTIEMPVAIDTATAAENIIAYQFDVTYDATKLQYIGNSLVGTIADGGSVMVNATTLDTLSVGYMGNTPLVGKGNIIKLKFQTLAYGTTPVTLSNALLNDKPVADIQNATVTVVDAIRPTATVAISSNNKIREGEQVKISVTYSEPLGTSIVPAINLSGVMTSTGVALTRINDSLYTYSFTVVNTPGLVSITVAGADRAGNAVVATPLSGSSFTIDSLRYGDFDENGKIQAYDAALILQYSVGMNPLPTIDPLPISQWRFATGNVDGEGNLTANDAAQVLKRSLNLMSAFDVEKRTKSGDESTAEVQIAVIADSLVFSSTGTLYGLNMVVGQNRQSLGKPMMLNNKMMSVSNINESTYAIGIATAYAPATGEVFMKIPLNGHPVSTIDFQMTVNTTSVTKSVDASKNVTGFGSASTITFGLYPNPVGNRLGITVPEDCELVSYQIMSVTGAVVLSGQWVSSYIDVKELAKGMYIIKLSGNNGIFTERFVKE